MMKEKKLILKDQRILLLLVIFVIIFAVTVINPKFITIKNIVTILGQISVIGILTMAMSMLLISGGIDLFPLGISWHFLRLSWLHYWERDVALSL